MISRKQNKTNCLAHLTIRCAALGRPTLFLGISMHMDDADLNYKLTSFYYFHHSFSVADAAVDNPHIRTQHLAPLLRGKVTWI